MIQTVTQEVDHGRAVDLAMDAEGWSIRAYIPREAVRPLRVALADWELPRHRVEGPAQPVHTLANHDHPGQFMPACPWCQPRSYAELRARHRAEEIR